MNLEAQEKFIMWLFDKHLKYGDWFDEWWNKEGKEAFFVYARAKGQEFLNIREINE